MATIESLDLATLTNNPQSIAEALEDVLEVSSGNISSLKATAQSDQEYISNTLKPAAQADADTLSDLVDDAPTADVLSLDLSVTNLASSWSYQNSYQNGFSQAPRIYAFMGFVFFSDYIYRGSGPSTTTVVGSISNSDYHPIETTFMPAVGHQGDTVEQFRFDTNGELVIVNPHNVSATPFFLLANGFYRYETA